MNGDVRRYRTMVSDRHSSTDGLHGRDLFLALLLLTALGVLYVGWKYVKHTLLAESFGLPAGMRDYWIVFALAWLGFILWAWKTRLRD